MVERGYCNSKGGHGQSVLGGNRRVLVRRLATVARETVGGPREATDGARRWESYGRRTPVGELRTAHAGGSAPNPGGRGTTSGTRSGLPA